MNSTTKRLQAYAARDQANYYEAEAQSWWQNYWTAAERRESQQFAILYRKAQEKAEALALAAHSLRLQACSLRQLEATCTY